MARIKTKKTSVRLSDVGVWLVTGLVMVIAFSVVGGFEWWDERPWRKN